MKIEIEKLKRKSSVDILKTDKDKLEFKLKRRASPDSKEPHQFSEEEMHDLTRLTETFESEIQQKLADTNDHGKKASCSVCFNPHNESARLPKIL